MDLQGTTAMMTSTAPDINNHLGEDRKSESLANLSTTRIGQTTSTFLPPEPKNLILNFRREQETNVVRYRADFAGTMNYSQQSATMPSPIFAEKGLRGSTATAVYVGMRDELRLETIVLASVAVAGASM